MTNQLLEHTAFLAWSKRPFGQVPSVEILTRATGFCSEWLEANVRQDARRKGSVAAHGHTVCFDLRPLTFSA